MLYPLSHRRLLALLAISALVVVSPLQSNAGQFEAPPATQPTTDKSAAPEPVGAEVEAAMRKAFAELGDRDPAVRDAARQSLMGLERRYLPALQRLVTETKPLLP